MVVFTTDELQPKSMSFLHRNGLMLRVIAVVLTAYCVLASGRALIPGVCATLADTQQ